MRGHSPRRPGSRSKRVVQFVRYQLRLSDAETPELAVAADEADGRRGGSAPSADVAEAVASALSDPKGAAPSPGAPPARCPPPRAAMGHLFNVCLPPQDRCGIW